MTLYDAIFEHRELRRMTIEANDLDEAHKIAEDVLAFNVELLAHGTTTLVGETFELLRVISTEVVNNG
jgi:hypothetical protein